MLNDDKDDGYSEEEEDESCPSYVLRHIGEIDESLISHVPGSSMNGEPMTTRLLAECAEAVHVPTRQSAARQILEALQFAAAVVEAYSEQEDVEKVFMYINKLSLDSEIVVRCNLLSSLPKVASFCAEYDSPLVSLKELIVSDILPILLKAIADEDRTCNMRVRIEGYAVLKYLLNNNLVTQKNIENKISDIYTSLLYHPNDIVNLITAGNFIARMAPVVGEAMTEKLLLPKISDLCTNQYSKTREACVHYLIDLACHVNPLVTENIIIPLFIKLSEDHAWSVRRACAETIVVLSCLSLMETRKTVLTRVFLNLLPDLETAVLSVAYKQLGLFMTSFAQPALIALGSNRSGDYLLIHCQSGSTFELTSRRSLFFQFYEQPEQNSFSMFMLPMKTFGNGGLEQGFDFNSTGTGGKEQSNTDIDVNCGDQNYCMNNVEDNVVEENSENTYCTNANEEAVVNEVNDDANGNTNTETPGSTIDSYFENLAEKEEHNKLGAQENEGIMIGSEYKNQPDLVQSCLKIPSKRSKKFAFDRRMRRKSVPDGSVEADSFNSFQFWREPIPEFDEHDLPTSRKMILDKIYANRNKYDEHVEQEGDFEDNYEFETSDNEMGAPWKGSEMKLSPPHSVRRMVWEKLQESEGKTARDKYSYNISMNQTPKQNVLPQALLDAYNEMVLSVSLDVKMHCAYTFPAVVLTLGPLNWHLVKDTYAKLATDSERQLRQMIASSIHEIASILGPEIATEDLIPIYNSLINDIEDIRIAALNHLSCFVKLLKPHGRCQFLPNLMEYMMTDYVWNWRFRQQLCEQLIEMMHFFAPTDCWKYVSPVAFCLLMDRVSAVRLQALDLVTHLIRVVSVDLSILRGVLAELAEQFAHSTHWTRRQSFAFLCSSLLRTPVLPDDLFARDVLPHLLDLSWDSIPNVRIAVARTLSCDVINYPYFSNVFSPHYDVLTQVLKRLYKDKDRDVRYFASFNTSAVPPLTLSTSFEVS